jgi:hypothetical protein
MKRREFLKILTLGLTMPGILPEAIAQMQKVKVTSPSHVLDDHIKDYLHKIKNFDKLHVNDIYIEQAEYDTFKSVLMRLRRLQKIVGHGNYHILSFNIGLKVARKYSEVGAFTRKELEFMEKIFYAEAKDYGFLDEKPFKKITDRVRNKDVVKIPATGNYIFKGRPLQVYESIKKEIGENMILTSGIRGVMKQFLLFLNKVYANEGNLSLASRSLAPPGYSYHSKGDFDVGQIGMGADNFTDRFATTEVYRRLSDMGYLKLRYPQNNLLGVRFEPWHIKI